MGHGLVAIIELWQQKINIIKSIRVFFIKPNTFLYLVCPYAALHMFPMHVCGLAGRYHGSNSATFT